MQKWILKTFIRLCEYLEDNQWCEIYNSGKNRKRFEFADSLKFEKFIPGGSELDSRLDVAGPSFEFELLFSHLYSLLI